MALTFKLDSEQFAELVKLRQSIDDFSTNLGKWQGTQTDAINNGFDNLIRFLSGDTGEEQTVVDRLTGNVKAAKDKLKSSVDTQTKGETKSNGS